MSAATIEEHKTQVIQLIKYLEGTVNFLGDPLSVAKEKEVIINNSYLKIFKDDKVQIEDDLDDAREVPLHKDVQAYLKDIGFFFTRVKFQFIIIDIDHFVTDGNEHYFKVTFNRDMQGLSIEGDSIHSRKIRYMEINLDLAENDLKIASIYTTKINEKEEARNWWNGLNKTWRQIFGSQIFIADSIEFSRIALIDDNFILIEKKSEENMPEEDLDYKLELPENRNFQIPALNLDSIIIDTRDVYNRLAGIRKIRKLDISGNEKVQILEPLNQLAELVEIDCSNTLIRNLFPIRNLNKLQLLDISNTPLTDISPLVYSQSLKNLNCSYTLVYDASVIKNLTNLVKLNLAGLRINNTEFLNGLTQIQELDLSNTEIALAGQIPNLSNLIDLDFSGTAIQDLEELSGMQNLKYLSCDNTTIQSVKPLAGLPKLEILRVNNTSISDLKPLQSIPTLKRIYWDSNDLLALNAEARKNEAIRFMRAKPATLVIFESEDLLRSWDALEEPWKKIATEATGLPENPTKEDLHGLLQIEYVNLTNSGVTTLDPIQRLYNLNKLIMKNLKLEDFSPLSQAIELEELDISGTNISKLSELKALNHLKILDIRHTEIKSLSPLTENSNLQVIYADSSSVTEKTAFDFVAQNPMCIVIFQTNKLNEWWGLLSEAWKTYFKSNYRLNSPPLPIQLHKIIFSTSIEISNQDEIITLEPLKMLKGLKTLKVNNMQGLNLQSISSFENLQTLHLYQVAVSDVSFVSGNRKLTELNIENTAVSDLSPISDLDRLTNLNISGTQVKSLKAISKLVQLEEFELNNTLVKNIKALEGLTNLKSLKCFNTRISEKNMERFKATNPRCKVVYY